jgi:hypothetical protein
MDGARSDFPARIGNIVGIMHEVIRGGTRWRSTARLPRARPKERNQRIFVRADAGPLCHLRTKDRNEVLSGVFDVAHVKLRALRKPIGYGVMPLEQF